MQFSYHAALSCFLAAASTVSAQSTSSSMVMVPASSSMVLMARPSASVNVTTVTTVVPSFVTFCPSATQITMGQKTYSITEATTLTITDCPCTIKTTIPCPTSGPTSTGAWTYPPPPMPTNVLGSAASAVSGVATVSGAAGAATVQVGFMAIAAVLLSFLLL